MKNIMAGSGDAKACKTSFSKCGLNGEGNCGDASSTGKCYCTKGSHVAEDLNCNE